MGRYQAKSSERVLNKQIDVSKSIAKLDFNKSVISGNRQEWINKLREYLSEYLGKAETYSMLFNKDKNDDVKAKTLINDDLSELLALEVKIVLMLNSTEKDSNDLIKELKKYTDSLFRGNENTSSKDIKIAIVVIAKRILKTEWERVKKGE